jgi:hypothetical protein
MTTGLDTFDGFSWASLLAGRDVLVLDPDAARGLRTANALDAAGARASRVATVEAALDRMLRRAFVVAVVALPGEASLDEILAAQFAAAGLHLMLLAEPARHAALRARHPGARVAGLDLGERQFVMLLTGTADE